jgi:hypothetical protein
MALAAVAESAPPAGGLAWPAMVWAFVNSPAGLTVIGAVLFFILGKVFTAKPAWKQYVLKYGPALMVAIKQAEKAIDDKTPRAGLARLDKALKLVIALEPKLAGAKADDVKAALTAVHTQAEANGNLE